MTFLDPSAFFALILLVVPVLIHLLVHRRAERLLFPSLRFIQPARLTSLRRRMLDDVPLLAVRAAILVAAIAALAAPVFLTAARQREWNARVVRAAVGARGFQPRDGAARPFQARAFDASDVRDGIRRAVAWLDTAPPARREMVIASAFPIGSLTAEDIAAVPASIGLRFERTGALPESRTVDDARVMTGGGATLSRSLTLAGGRTRVHEIRVADRASFPVEVDAPADATPAIDAAIAAVLTQRVWAPPPDRRARLVIIDRSAESLALRVMPINVPWIAEAIARMSRDAELQAAASGTTGALDARFTTAPWHVVALGKGAGAEPAPPGPLIAAAGSASELLVASAAGPLDLVTPLLLRSMVNGLAMLPDVRQAEVVSIPDAELEAWSRPAPPPGAPRLDTLEDDQDDRRWFWASVLLLLALEAWMRRARATGGGAVAEVDMGESFEPANNVA